jgi:hypothetical protein
MLAPAPARASVSLADCYEQRATTPVPVAVLQNALPDALTAAGTDPLGVIGEYTVRAYRCDDRELILVTVPIQTPTGFQPGPDGSAALLFAFSEDAPVTAELFAGCFGQVTQTAVITFGVIDAGYARTGVVFNDAGLEGIGTANEVGLDLGDAGAESVRLFIAKQSGQIYALDLSQGASQSLTGAGIHIFQSGLGPLGTPTQPAIVEHRFANWTLTLDPLSTC